MKTKTVKARPLTPSQRLEDLSNIVYLCFILLGDYDFKEICNLSKLSLRTIRRLYCGDYSLKLQWNTVQKLAAAANLKFTTDEYGPTRFRIVD